MYGTQKFITLQNCLPMVPILSQKSYSSTYIVGICTDRIAMAKGAFNKKRALFSSKMNLELRKK
jgi:hypothetical protein